MREVNVNILSASDTTSQNGSQIDSNQLISASIQAIFGDATAAGTIKLQMSNDELTNGNSQSFVVTNWTDIPSATATVVAGASVVVIVPQLCARWIRAVYTSSSGGSTTVNVNLFALSV